MTIIQITDTHVTGPHSSDFDVDLSANLERALRAIERTAPDVLVLTGDVFCDENCHEHARTVFRRMAAICPSFFVLPGNHDDPRLLAEAADGIVAAPPEWPHATIIDGVRMLLLDTSNDSYGTENLVWTEIQAQEAALSGEKLLIFAHHPPCRMGRMPYLDLYFAPTDTDETERVLSSLQSRFDLFCGHYHLEAERRLGNGIVHITAPVSFTVHPSAETIQLVRTDPCMRVISVDTDLNSVKSEHRVITPDF